MIEAKQLGFYVPENMYKRWLSFQASQAVAGKGSMMDRVYRLYLLALAGKPEYSAMNIIRENNLSGLNTAQKWLLAGAYSLSSYGDTASKILAQAGTAVNPYRESGGTYGSEKRDRAVILDVSLAMNKTAEAAMLYKELAKEINSQAWLSTQELGYSLLAMGKYIMQIDNSGSGLQLAGSIRLPSGRILPFKTDAAALSFDIPADEGTVLEVNLSEKAEVIKNCYAYIDYSYVPLTPDLTEKTSNLNVFTEYYTEEGAALKPASLKQGDVFWAGIRAVKQTRNNLEELALVYMLPSGWEIENIRFFKEKLPETLTRNVKDHQLNRQKYTDIRDDRIMWFFDMKDYNSGEYWFFVKLRAVTEGNFLKPPVLFEAMYDNSYTAVKEAMKVTVRGNTGLFR
jgi:hypothetical protein